ncbi:MAG: hypothetical protein R2705_17750 [Ilumatobacteraceae bacterium]
MIATQKQAEMRLNAKIEELGKLNGQARQALIMAEDASKKGDAAAATKYSTAAETIASRLIAVEKDVDSQKAMVMQATQASIRPSPRCARTRCSSSARSPRSPSSSPNSSRPRCRRR